MVTEQLKKRGVVDEATLRAFLTVPRDRFVPESARQSSYADMPLPIGEGQTISQPFIVALMVQEAYVSSKSNVLEIGTGSGYAAAILSRIAQRVYTIERLESLHRKSSELFKELGYDNIVAKHGDGSVGLLKYALYDAIIVSAGVPTVPEPLKKQLAIGGALLIPVGDQFGQTLLRITRLSKTEYRRENIELVRFVPLIGEEGWADE